jgi:hypothetical protein
VVANKTPYVFLIYFQSTCIVNSNIYSVLVIANETQLENTTKSSCEFSYERNSVTTDALTLPSVSEHKSSESTIDLLSSTLYTTGPVSMTTDPSYSTKLLQHTSETESVSASSEHTSETESLSAFSELLVPTTDIPFTTKRANVQSSMRITTGNISKALGLSVMIYLL